jgi:hypothetical protein
MPDNKEKASGKSRRMQKRVETKDDGRLLIYYTFEAVEDDGSERPAKSEAVRK